MKRRKIEIIFLWRVLCFSYFFFQIFCEERYMFYSKLEVKKTKNSSLALFDLQRVSLIQCGSLCLAEYCCKEFMYNRGSMRCLGIQFEDFDSIGNTKLIRTGYEGLSTYCKGNLVYITTLFPSFYPGLFLSPLHNMWFCYSLSFSLSLSLSLSQLL